MFGAIAELERFRQLFAERLAAAMLPFELLRDGERSVGALQAELALDSGGTSQHLAALRRIGLVESRREGTSVFYRVDDARVFDLLEAGRAIIERPLVSQQALLRDLRTG